MVADGSARGLVLKRKGVSSNISAAQAQLYFRAHPLWRRQ